MSSQENGKKDAYKSAKKDNFNSTFIQTILFANGKKITGYSAQNGFHEKNDKSAVLINWILRMYKVGYLDLNNYDKDDIEYIEYFLNLKSDKKSQFKLYFDYYELTDANESIITVVNFLDKFYAEIKNGLTTKELFNLFYRSDKSPTIDPMDYKKKRFITRLSLENYLDISFNKKVLSMEQCTIFQREYLKLHNIK